MALQKDIVSARTGATLGYHAVVSTQIGEDSTTVVVARYVNAAAKLAGKMAAESSAFNFAYDGAAINQTALAYAEGLLLTLPEFAGAAQVA